MPNVSEGRDPALVEAIGAAFVGAGARLLNTHSDPDHHRSVFTLAGVPGELAGALAAGAEAALGLIDLRRPRGLHPHVGAVDVIPVVHRTEAERGAACAEALVCGEQVGRLGVPVYLYGALGGGRTRAELRREGTSGVLQRAGRPDFGPAEAQAASGVTLLAARAPLIAFNIELAAPAGREDARAIAARIREGGEAGVDGLRAIGLTLPSRGGVAQVSMNVERVMPLVELVEAVERYLPVSGAELVGLAPAAALAGFPERVALRGFDPARHVLESALSGR